MATTVLEDHPADAPSRVEFVIKKYRGAIAYYWRSANRNKNAFRRSRLATIVLGSVVTLFASLGSSTVFTSHENWITVITLGTPVLAALLTILSALSQTFQWEAAWRENVLTAEHMAKEQDRIVVTDVEKVDFKKELDRLNALILDESSDFFDRILGRSTPVKTKPAT